MVIAIYLVILVAAFFFLIVRPQRRQQMLRRQLVSTVGVGDEIITSGGVYGTVVVIDGDTLDLEIAPGVVVKLARGAVANLITEDDEYEGEGEGDDEGDDDDDDVEGGDDRS